MAKEIINTGAFVNDRTGDKIRASFIKTNQNMDELYTALGDGSVLDDIVSQSGATAATQVGVWTGDGVIGGAAGLLWNGTALTVTGDIIVTGTVDGIDLATRGDTFKVGVPANNQVGVWTGDGTLEGDANLVWSGTDLTVTGNIIVTGTVDGVDLLTRGDTFKVGVPVNNQVGVWTGDGTLEGDVGLVWSGTQLAVLTTDSIQLPSGTTGQRPSVAAGLIRYNSSLGRYEGYDTAWKNFVLDGQEAVRDPVISLDTNVYSTTATLSSFGTNDVLQFNRKELRIPVGGHRFITFEPYLTNHPYSGILNNAVAYIGRTTRTTAYTSRESFHNFVFDFGTSTIADSDGYGLNWNSSFWGSSVIFGNVYFQVRANFADVITELTALTPPAGAGHFVLGYVTDLSRYYFGIRNEYAADEITFSFGAGITYSAS